MASTQTGNSNDDSGEYRFVFAGGSYATIATIKFLCSDIIPKLFDRKKPTSNSKSNNTKHDSTSSNTMNGSTSNTTTDSTSNTKNDPNNKTSINTPITKVSVTVIAPNREAYWNVAAVRLIAEPELLETKKDQLFFSLESTLRQYFPKVNSEQSDDEKNKNDDEKRKSDDRQAEDDKASNKSNHDDFDPRWSLEIIQGKVVSINPEQNTISYLKMNDEGLAPSTARSNNSNNQNQCNQNQQDPFFFGNPIKYDTLIIATGASSSSPAFKLNASALVSKRALQKIHESVHCANSIAVVGAGGVGVELAGELAFKYGKTKDITLYSDFSGTLGNLKPKVAAHAVKQLEDLNVKVMTKKRVVGIRQDELYSTRLNGRTDLVSYQNKRDQRDKAKDQRDKGSKEKSVEIHPVKSHSSSILDHRRISQKLKHSLTRHSSSSSSNNESTAHDSIPTTTTPNSIPTNSHTPKTILTFADGTQSSVDCCIPATGNIPNSSFLPYNSLDENGYILVDPYLRMLYNNPRKNIYIVGDVISGGRETINDITTAQKHTLKCTLYHDLVDKTAPLRIYKVSEPWYLVAVSKNGGVGTLNGLVVPSFVVTWMKAKNFRMDEARNYLE